LNDEQRLDWLRLIRSENVGPRTFHDLVKYYGGVGPALTALPGLARRGGSARAPRIFSREQALAELKAAQAAGVEYIILTLLGGKEQLRRFAREVMPAFADQH